MKALAVIAIGIITTVAAAGNADTPKLSTASKVKDLLANPATLAVLTADIPQIVANPQLQMALDMPLASIARYEPEALSADNLKTINADLAKVQPQRPVVGTRHERAKRGQALIATALRPTSHAC